MAWHPYTYYTYEVVCHFRLPGIVLPDVSTDKSVLLECIKKIYFHVPARALDFSSCIPVMWQGFRKGGQAKLFQSGFRSQEVLFHHICGKYSYGNLHKIKFSGRFQVVANFELHIYHCVECFNICLLCSLYNKPGEPT